MENKNIGAVKIITGIGGISAMIFAMANIGRLVNRLDHRAASILITVSFALLITCCFLLQASAIIASFKKSDIGEVMIAFATLLLTVLTIVVWIGLVGMNPLLVFYAWVLRFGVVALYRSMQ
jgi:hypothetical protein